MGEALDSAVVRCVSGEVWLHDEALVLFIWLVDKVLYQLTCIDQVFTLLPSILALIYTHFFHVNKPIAMYYSD